MKTTTLAAATFVLSGAFLVNQDTAFAKGPLEIEGSSPLILVKETPKAIDLKDFPFGLEEGRTENFSMTFNQDVPLPDTEEPFKITYTLTASWLEVEKDGDDKVMVAVSDDQNVEMTMSMEGEDVTFNIEAIAEDTVMTFVRDGERMTYTGSSSAFNAEVTSPQAAEEGVDFKYTLAGKGIAIKGDGIASMDFTDLTSMDIAYDYTLDSLNFGLNMSGEGMGGDALEVTGEAGELSATGLIRDGRLESGSQITDFTLEVIQPMPLEVFLAKFNFGMAMPTEPSPEPQDIKYLIEAEDIQLSDQLWAMMDPAEAFPRKLDKLVLDLEMKAMMMVSIFDPESMAEAEASGMPPMIPTSVTINSVAFDGLGLEVEGNGQGELKGTQPDGKAFLSVKGLSDFLASAKAMGMLGDQEVMMFEGMAGQLGKEGPDGALTFDVKTEGAMIHINDAPIAPIPSMQ